MIEEFLLYLEMNSLQAMYHLLFHLMLIMTPQEIIIGGIMHRVGKRIIMLMNRDIMAMTRKEMGVVFIITDFQTTTVVLL